MLYKQYLVKIISFTKLLKILLHINLWYFSPWGAILTVMRSPPKRWHSFRASENFKDFEVILNSYTSSVKKKTNRLLKQV